MKCPVIKTFRAELTKKLLNINNRSTSLLTANNNNTIYAYNPLNFPPLPVPQLSSNNPVMSKLDDLMEKITDVKEHITNLALKHEKFEKFMVDKACHDTHVTHQIDPLSKVDQELKKDLLQHHLILERHENMFMKLLIPMFEDLFLLIAAQNQDKKGNTLDADLKCRLDRYLIQMKKTREGKQFLN